MALEGNRNYEFLSNKLAYLQLITVLVYAPKTIFPPKNLEQSYLNF